MQQPEYRPVEQAIAFLQDPSRCPGCAAPLPGRRCDACGLDVGAPSARGLWDLSLAAARSLAARQEHLADMYRTQRAAYGAPVAPSRLAPVPAVLAVEAPAPARPTQARPAPPRPTPAAVAPASTAPPTTRTPVRVQTVLQILGAALLAIAAITFVAVAWGTMPLPVRASVVAIGTLLVLLGAAGLRTAAPGGAEALGGLGAALLLVDAWALHATGLVPSPGGGAYAALSAAACGLLLLAWGIGVRLRSGTVPGVVLLAVAPPLTLLETDLVLPRVALLSASALLCLVRFVPRFATARLGRGAGPDDDAVPTPGTGRPHRHPESVSLAVVSVVVLATAIAIVLPTLLGALVGEDVTVEAVVSLAVLALTSGTTAIAAGRSSTIERRSATVWASATGAALVAAVALAATLVAFDARPSTALACASVGGVAAACIGSLVAARVPRRRLAEAAGAGRVTAAVLALPCLVSAPTIALVAGAAGPRPTLGAALLRTVLALGVCAVLVLLTGAQGRRPGSTPPLPRFADVAAHWLVALVLVLGVLATAQACALRLTEDPASRTGPAALIVSAALAALAVGTAVLGTVGPATGSPSVRHLSRGATVAAVVLVLLPMARSLSVPATAEPSAAPVIALGCAAITVAALAARRWTASATLVTVAGVVATVTGAGTLAALLDTLGTGTAVGVRAAGTVVVLGVIASCVPTLAPVWRATRARTLVGLTPGRAERATTQIVGVVVATALAGQSFDSPATWTVVACALGCALAAALLLTPLAPLETRTGAAVLLAAGLGATVAAVDQVAGIPAPPGAGTVLVLVGGAMLLLTGPRITGPAPLHRSVAEASGAVAACVGLTAALTAGSASASTALAVGAVVCAARALHPLRRPLAWASLALASAAWWTALAGAEVESVETYLAPVGVLLIGCGVWRARRSGVEGAPLVGAGAALVLLPPAALDGVVPVLGTDRAVVAFVGATVLVGAGLLAQRRTAAPATGPSVAQVLLGLAVATTVIGPLRRTVGTALDPVPGVQVEAGAIACAVLVALAVGALTRDRFAAAGASRLVRGLVAAALLTVLVAPELLAIRSTTAGTLRTLAVGAVAAALALTAAGRARPWRAPRLGWTPCSAASLALGLATTALATAVAAGVGIVGPGGATAGVDVLIAVCGAVTLGAGLLWCRTHGPAWWAWSGPALVTAAAIVTTVTRTDGTHVAVVGVGAWAVVAVGLVLAGRTAPLSGSTLVRWCGPHALLAGSGVLLALAAPGLVALLSALAGWASGDVAPVSAVEPWALASAATVAGALVPRSALPLRGRVSTLDAALVVGAVPVLCAAGSSTVGVVRALVLLAVGAAWTALGHRAVGIAVTVAATVALLVQSGGVADELALAMLGAVLLVDGVRQLAGDPSRGSWGALSPGLAGAVVVPLLVALAAPTPTRTVAAAVLVIGTTAVGAVRRWQAPFVLGALGTAALVVIDLGTGLVRSLDATIWWVVLALGGAGLLALGITYERRMRQVRSAVLYVRGLR